jgi:AraC-like DNA-binding protein
MQRTNSSVMERPRKLPIPAFGDQLLFHTRDLDEARDKVADVYTSHHLDHKRRNKPLDTWFYHSPMADSAINYLGYGSDMVVNPGELEKFFLVQTPVSGGGDVCCGKQHIITSTRRSSVLSPTESVKMIWDANCWQAQVKLDRSLTERCLGQLLGEHLPRPLVFKLGLEMQSDAGKLWWNTVQYVANEVVLMKSIPNSARMIRQMELLLINTLLHVQPHNYSSELNQEAPNIAPRHVKRAEDYIEAHCGEDVTIDDLLRVSDVSARTLYNGFQKFRSTSPMKFLKATRLDKVNQVLRNADPCECVTRIAIDHGFKQLGRFAVDYRQRFGESPSDTLKKRH